MRVRFTLALTPALSPGERGNRPPVSGEFARALVRVGLRSENQKTGAAKLTVERARRAACALPLLGERAGVRASVQTGEPRENIERPTSNTERRSERGFALPFDVRRWMFDVGCSPGSMERGNRPPVSGEFARALVRVGLRCENQKTGAAKWAVERARRVACALPLLGERAGVRASVQPFKPEHTSPA